MLKNLRLMFEQTDSIDLREGELAYPRYRQVMIDLSEMYGVPLPRVVAAFCALSPNNDYYGNLRSVVSVLDGYAKGIDRHRVIVSTYNHCKLRAWEYVEGSVLFTERARGDKILSFYHNIMDPTDPRHVTVDGHICATWRGQNLTMKEAIIRSRHEYAAIAFDVKQLAFEYFMLPNQMQAVLWFVRKRVLNVRYDPQLSLLAPGFEAWHTSRDVRTITAYPLTATP